MPRGCEEEEGQRKKLKTASPGRKDKVHVYRIRGVRCILLLGQKLSEYAKVKGHDESEKQACRM